MKMSRVLLACTLVFAFCSLTLADQFWVVKEKSGKCVVVKKKPIDASMIVKGPFHSRKKAKLVARECTPGGRAAAVEYWVIREPSGTLVIVEEKPSDRSVIVKGPFRERRQAEVVIKKSPRGGAVAPKRGSAERLKAVPGRTKPGETSAPGASKPAESVKPQPPSGEGSGVSKPSEKPLPGGGDKSGASTKEEKPPQTKE